MFSNLTEEAILRTIAQVVGQLGGHTGFEAADDAFVLPVTEPSRLILTTDMLVDGQHFDLRYCSAQDVGWKAAAVNISDVAAMGGQLRYLLVSVGLPKHTELAFVKNLYEGLQLACKTFGGQIVGGDTVSSPTLVVNVTAVGMLPAGHTAGERQHARPGDVVLTTGSSGLSAVGLRVLQSGLAQKTYPEACRQHRRPMPRVEAGLLLSRVLSKHCQRYALMDTSDGLANAALKIAQASSLISPVQVILEADKLPRHPEVLAYCMRNSEAQTAEKSRSKLSLLYELMLYGGEDFELFATVPGEVFEQLQTVPGFPAQFQVIGRVEEATEPFDKTSLDQAMAYLAYPDGSREALRLEQTFRHF